MSASQISREEAMRRWRLILGGGEADGIQCALNKRDLGMDDALSSLYDQQERKGGLGGSCPKVSRWLGDIREYFSTSVVRVMQRDAMERLNLRQLLTEPEMLEAVQPDVHLVADLMSLSRVMPEKTMNTARMVVKKVVDELIKKLGATDPPSRQRGSQSRRA
jgi:hypothetical protein